jgi:hypothetical protein
VNEDGHDLFSKQSRADSNVPRIWTRLVILVAWYASTYVPVEIDEVAPDTEHKRLQARREDYAPCGKCWPSSTKTAFFSVGASCVMNDAEGTGLVGGLTIDHGGANDWQMMCDSAWPSPTQMHAEAWSGVFRLSTHRDSEVGHTEHTAAHATSAE